MADIPLILDKGQIILSQTGSSLDITFSNSPALFGQVEAVSDLTDKYSVGDNVCFDPNNTKNFTYSGTQYILADEKSIIFKEGDPL